MQSFFADSGELEITSEEEIEDEDATMTFAPFDTETDAPETTAARDEESIADKLQRIRAVVSRQDEADADYEDEEEDETATGAFEMPAVAKASLDPAKDSAIERELTEAAQDIEEALDADAAALDRNAEIESEEDELDAILSRIEAEEGDAEDNSLFAQADDYDEPEEEADNESLGNLFEDEDDAETGKAPVHARALKVNRADLQAALDQGELEDLSALEETHTSAIQPEAHKHAARDSLPDIDASAEKDVSRLMAEADHQMQEPEGRTRRSAFAHLRAAVAARFADRSMEKDAVAEKEEADAYRSDLAEAVKPRRPVAAVVKSERPAEARPVPLTLVAEQRIDAEAIKSNGGVSPRRVAASEDEYSTDGDTGFVEFAEEMGAVDLPELLEAAAAYLSFVEGQEQFSRPQLMSRVRQAKKDDFSREDGLRSFGMLLRTGKIEKIKGGRFAASEEIGFKPDHRAAG